MVLKLNYVTTMFDISVRNFQKTCNSTQKFLFFGFSGYKTLLFKSKHRVQLKSLQNCATIVSFRKQCALCVLRGRGFCIRIPHEFTEEHFPFLKTVLRAAWLLENLESALFISSRMLLILFF